MNKIWSNIPEELYYKIIQYMRHPVAKIMRKEIDEHPYKYLKKSKQHMQCIEDMHIIEDAPEIQWIRRTNGRFTGIYIPHSNAALKLYSWLQEGGGWRDDTLSIGIPFDKRINYGVWEGMDFSCNDTYRFAAATQEELGTMFCNLDNFNHYGDAIENEIEEEIDFFDNMTFEQHEFILEAQQNHLEELCEESLI